MIEAQAVVSDHYNAPNGSFGFDIRCGCWPNMAAPVGCMPAIPIPAGGAPNIGLGYKKKTNISNSASHKNSNSYLSITSHLWRHSRHHARCWCTPNAWNCLWRITRSHTPLTRNGCWCWLTPHWCAHWSNADWCSSGWSWSHLLLTLRLAAPLNWFAENRNLSCLVINATIAFRRPKNPKSKSMTWMGETESFKPTLTFSEHLVLFQYSNSALNWPNYYPNRL